MEFKKHQPTLFVGLGGAGGSVVNRIASILHKREDWTDLQHVIQFFALDTDKADLDSHVGIPQAHRFVISGFDKGTWVREKLGRLSVSANKEDERVSQWIHSWYNFRKSQGAGAGQIRVESRVSLYNCMETTDLIKRVENAILATISKDNNFVAHEVKKFNVFIYYTVAGGTGSGAHLMLAAFLRHTIANFGWSANITGVAMQSTLITPFIRNMRQREDILANGYSAMKEIEHLMRLKVFSDQRDPSNRREFVFHPFVATNEISESPFDFVYVLDTNPDVYIQNFKTTAADAIYLQLFSPIFAKRNSDFDNFEKNQKRLARSKYSTFYGSYGCSVLTLPDKDLLKYSTDRKTADTISEYLSTGLEVETMAGTKSFAPSQKDLDSLDEKDQAELWDKSFIDYMRAKLSEERGSELNPENLGNLGRDLRNRGFHHNVNLISLDKVDTTGSYLDDFGDSSVQDMLPVVSDADDSADIDQSEAQGGSLMWSAENMVDTLESAFLSSIHGGGAKQVLLLQKQGKDSGEDGFRFNKSKDYGEFCTFLTTKIHSEITRSISDALDQSIPDEISKEFSAGEAERELREYAGRFKNAFDPVQRSIENTEERLSQIFSVSQLTNWFTEREIPIDQLRLSVLIYQKLSERYVDFLSDHAKLDAFNLSKAFLLIEQQNYEELQEKRKLTFGDFTDAISQGGNLYADYIECSKSIGVRIRSFAERYGAILTTHYMLAVQKHLVKVFSELNGILREFSRQASNEIRKIIQVSEDFRKDPGEQSDEYFNDIEALQSFTGERIWNEYYDCFVKGEVQLKSKTVYNAIGSVLTNNELPTPRDKLDQLNSILSKEVEAGLKPVITGKYSAGRKNRGLTLQVALEREAQIKFKSWLEAKGRWDDECENWHKVVHSPHPNKLRSKSQVDLYKEIQDFSRNYLETKISACIRRSAIMANVNMNDKEVTEYSCRQYMFCYDTSLYGSPEPDSNSLDFPSLVHRINPEFDVNDYLDNGKMVIFYQAILGVPLFVFRNIIGEMKVAYDKRVPERNWNNPTKGERQYPLHIDKNWEVGDPGIDNTKLPLSLDPDEACISSSTMNETRAEFFAYWYSLNKKGHIKRDEDGFFVPARELGNDTDNDIRLGQTIRETVQQMIVARSAHAEIRTACKKLGLLDVEEIDDKMRKCEELIGGSVWEHQQEDNEIRELLDLFVEYKNYRVHQDTVIEEQRLREEAYATVSK
jgi:hypothetical protein